MKEHSSWKSPAKKLSHAISKSLGCVPTREPPHPVFPEQPEKPLDLANIVPPRPLANMNDTMVSHTSSGAPTPTKRYVGFMPQSLLRVGLAWEAEHSTGRKGLAFFFLL